MDLDVKMKATMLGAAFLIVSICYLQFVWFLLHHDKCIIDCSRIGSCTSFFPTLNEKQKTKSFIITAP